MERSHDDPDVVIVTYEEQHNHNVPYPEKLDSELAAQVRPSLPPTRDDDVSMHNPIPA